MAGMFKRSLQDAVTDAERAAGEGGVEEETAVVVEARGAGGRRLPDRALRGEGGGTRKTTTRVFIPGTEVERERDMHPMLDRPLGGGGGGGGGGSGEAKGKRRRRKR